MERDKWVAWLLVDPALAPLHADPRFAAIALDAGFQPPLRLGVGAS
jgi:hypothetical protein